MIQNLNLGTLAANFSKKLPVTSLIPPIQRPKRILALIGRTWAIKLTKKVTSKRHSNTTAKLSYHYVVI